MYLQPTITMIDEAIKAHFSFMCADKVQVMGLAQLARRTEDKVERVWPGAWDGNEYKYAGIDEDFNVITYHRSIGINSGRFPGGYGDSLGDIRSATSMSMVFFANRSAVAATKEELAIELQGMFPDTIIVPQSKFTSISINNIVLNEKQVFDEEYRNVDYFVGPEHILLKINYTIESRFAKDCFNNCRCEPAKETN